MSYQVLARKYRPQTFEEVIGQKPIVTTLQNAVEQSRIHHAYLFSGPRGVGKTTVARLMAKALNCEKGPTPRPCNACASCEEIAASRSLDVLEIDGASNRGIESIRELRETVRYAPARDRQKVFIIDEVHMLTPEAWNALLKTLEEPPSHVVFLFATTDYRKIPLTILSRCQHFEFKKIPRSEMLEHLKSVAAGEKISVQPDALDLICRLAGGSLRDAQSALDQVIGFSGETVTQEQAGTILGVIERELITGFFAAVRARDCARLVAIIDDLFEKGYQPVPFLEDLMAYGRDLLLARVVEDPGQYLTLDPQDVKALAEQAAAFSDDELLRLLELMTREEQRLKYSAHPRFLLEALAIKLARLADLRPIEELIARLEPEAGCGRGPTPGASPGRSASHPPAPRVDASAAGAAPPPRAEMARLGPQPASTPVVGAAPAETIAPTGGGDQALVKAILKKIHEEKGALGGFLGQAAWLEIVDGTLKIAFDPTRSLFREKVQARETLKYLRAAAAAVAGRPMQVEVVVATPSAPDGPTTKQTETDADRKERLREAALKEPVVQMLLQHFEGEIVDVEQT